MRPWLASFLVFTALFSVYHTLHACESMSAEPVWPAGREKEKNLSAGFRAVFEAPESGKAVFRVAASSLYRFYLNGKFMGHGPARGPHGLYRVDEWNLSGKLRPGNNLLAVEAAGYNINSYYLLDQPSFLQAEIVSNREVLASTGGGKNSFQALILKERVQKAQRFSFQRTFVEHYRLSPGYDRWRKEISAPVVQVRCETFQGKRLLPRGAPYPEFNLRPPVWEVSRGKVKKRLLPVKLWKDRSLTDVGPDFKGFEEKEIEEVISTELQKIVNAGEEKTDQPLEGGAAFKLEESSYHILDLGTNLTGFVGATIRAREKVKLYVTWDEILTSGDVDFKRLNCVNAIRLDLAPGDYQFESIEPYTMRFLKFIALEGECGIEDVYLREYVNPEAGRAVFACSDPRLNRLFEAGRETFRQNAVDIFMDCPSRERAGWLCDSYFIARAAFDLCGNTVLEKNFLENFILPESFHNLPPGMLPMCYPADHPGGRFIPNWALWFVLELEEYLGRSGDRATVEAAREKVVALFDYFKRFKNSDNLLEGLESWVFIEWSEANDFVQDVNYPTNMLYASSLEAAGRMYGLPEFIEEAEAVRNTVRIQSFDGEFFVDNALRKDGRLERTRNRTEVCQYYAFYTGTATREDYPELWTKLVKNFGPPRKETGAYPEVYLSRPFIGNVLRLEVLSGNGLSGQALDEAVGYYLEMARRTGTLWEFEGGRASCNHGFASHIVRVLYRDLLGVERVDPVRKEVALRFADISVQWCQGRLPVSGGWVCVNWWKDGGKIFYRADLPAGYKLSVRNSSGRELVREP